MSVTETVHCKHSTHCFAVAARDTLPNAPAAQGLTESSGVRCQRPVRRTAFGTHSQLTSATATVVQLAGTHPTPNVEASAVLGVPCHATPVCDDVRELRGPALVKLQCIHHLDTGGSHMADGRDLSATVFNGSCDALLWPLRVCSPAQLPHGGSLSCRSVATVEYRATAWYMTGCHRGLCLVSLKARRFSMSTVKRAI